jgi:hypothetical protein
MLVRISQSGALRTAVLCLIITVIALGASAKHKQFENSSRGTSYLTQSVKMVAGDDMPAVITPELHCCVVRLCLCSSPVVELVSPMPRVIPVAGPLLV